MKKIAVMVLAFLGPLQLREVGTFTNFAQERPRASSSVQIENYVVEDTSRQLGDHDREEIVRTVSKFYIDSVRSHQSTYVSSKIPVIKLLQFNYPKLNQYEEEGGTSIRNVMRVLNSDSANRDIINKVLTEQRNHPCS